MLKHTLLCVCERVLSFVFIEGYFSLCELKDIRSSQRGKRRRERDDIMGLEGLGFLCGLRGVDLLWRKGGRVFCGRRSVLRSSAVSVVDDVETEGVKWKVGENVCPNCRSELSLEATKCGCCGASFPKPKSYTDRVYVNTKESEGFSLPVPFLVRQEMFRSPLVSWLYERGWRNSFQTYGFPGPDKEFTMLMDYLKDNDAVGGTIMDLSCGSGFTARKMVASNEFERVIACDYSESMLMESRERFEKAGLISDKVEFIRADVSKLPFASKSIPAVHNGAAVHTYPNIQNALREIYRVLEDGGVLFGTTMDKSIFAGRNNVSSVGFRFFSADELYYLLKYAGFKAPVVTNINKCILFKAKKD